MRKRAIKTMKECIGCGKRDLYGGQYVQHYHQKKNPSELRDPIIPLYDHGVLCRRCEYIYHRITKTADSEGVPIPPHHLWRCVRWLLEGRSIRDEEMLALISTGLIKLTGIKR